MHLHAKPMHAPAADQVAADRRAVFLAIATLRDGLPAGPDLVELTDAQRSLLVDALRTIRATQGGQSTTSETINISAQ